MYDINLWLEEKEEIQYTLYQDACKDCIVSKFCLETFGTNPHLDLIGKKSMQDASEEVFETEESNDQTIDSKVQPEKVMIKQEKSTVKVDLKQREKVDISSVLEKAITNATIGTLLQRNQPLEIHPKVFIRHAALLGAAGSGKTVLGKVLIEEMLLQGYSAILIDPQGDLCSLILPDD